MGNVYSMKNEKTSSSSIDHEILPWIDSLVYKHDTQWVAFPDWAKFYLQLGTALSNHDTKETYLITAISVPVRSFAASLIAAGIVITRLSLPKITDESYIDKILSLPTKTPVIFRTNNKKYRGEYMGTSSIGKQRYFCIRYEKGLERAIPIESAGKIEILNNEKISIPKIQTGRDLTAPSSLLEKLIDKASLNRLIMESKLECLILGQINLIQQELCNLAIGFNIYGDQVADGRLEDLVRAKGPQFQPSVATYRSYVWSSSSRYSPQTMSKISNYVTLFDNPLGFIKWRSFFRKSNWIVILDRTDRNFELAIKDINDEFVQYRLSQQTRTILPNPPSGVDLMLYEVKA